MLTPEVQSEEMGLRNQSASQTLVAWKQAIRVAKILAGIRPPLALRLRPVGYPPAVTERITTAMD